MKYPRRVNPQLGACGHEGRLRGLGTWILGRRLTLLGALALLLPVFGVVALGVNAPQAHAAGASARASGAGAISGVVENGTHGNAAVAGQAITLQLSVGGKANNVATTTSDAQGHFSFTNIDLSSASALDGSFAVYTQYQGGVYSDGPIDLTANPSQSVTLMIYDATQSSANLSVGEATILVRTPDVTHGLVGIGEFVTMRNSGTTAFVGDLPAAGSGAAMPALLRFSLPANAQNVTTGVGFFGTTAIQISTGFGAAVTVPPGQTEFAFAYDLPYTGTTLSVPYKAEYATSQVVALVPPDMLVRSASSGVAAQGIVTTFGARYQVYTANNLAQDGQVSVNLYDLPQPGEPQDLNTSHLLWLALALALALVALLALYLKRGALAAALGLTPATTVGGALAATEPALVSGAGEADAECERLLRELLALERHRASGSIDAAQFKRADAALRERLRALLRALLADAATSANPTAATALAATEPAADGVATAEAPANADADAARVRSGGQR